MATILEARGLGKYFRHQWTFRRLHVLQRLDLDVADGEIFGLIGPNGAGKTTAFKLLLGLLRPTAGEVRFGGQPLHPAARAAIGFLPEQPYFYEYLTLEETLDFYARLYALPATTRRQRVAELIEQLQLTDKRRTSLRTLSKGTLQRVGIAQAIVARPRLLILDEPMSGLDPAGRHHMRELIKALRNEGTTVIFSSHILPDAEALCDRVGILARGRLCEIVPLHRTEVPEAYSMVVARLDAEALASLERLAGNPVSSNGGHWTLRLRDQAEVNAALDIVRRCNGLVASLTPQHPSLEERFLAHVGHVATLD